MIIKKNIFRTIKLLLIKLINIIYLKLFNNFILIYTKFQNFYRFKFLKFPEHDFWIR